ncbi:MAG: SCP2 sterol-binding domain-containing protein [Bdellovibrionota bacterium]
MKGDDVNEKSPEETEAPALEERPWRVSDHTASPTRHAEPDEHHPVESSADDAAVNESRSAGSSSATETRPTEHRSTESRSSERGTSEHRANEQHADDEDDADGFTHEGLPEYEQDDPLAPAYDIEKGTPLGSHRHDLPIRANIKNAKEFFNTELLYRYDILEDHERAELGGRYRIELKGFQGGVWTVQLGDNLDVVNRREDAEIVFTMQQNDFLQLVNGQLNPQLAMFAQKMRVHGDLKKAVRFQSLLSPEVD